ncbi:MAG: phosphoglycolate phosphatase [Spirochaetes bacterium ADurb.Bin110]|nr:MAG: phosphoglycolate phosphatase [Spirochaetes bacterium ADurb.Bin110]
MDKFHSVSLMPITSLTCQEAQRIRYILMDIDDTLTTDGKLLAESYAALWRLHEAGLKVIPVTGRPAGWCDLIAREWPADGVVGENGAFAFWEGEGHHLLTLSHPKAIPNTDPRLLALRDRVLFEIPGARLARDQFSRLYDIAIDFAEEEPILPLSEALRIQSIFIEGGAKAKISSIHVNAWMGDYDKLSMALSFLNARFGYDDRHEVCTVIFAGDSPNDEPMFEHFPMACAMANVLKYRELMKTPPHFVTQRESGAGFAELTDILLERRRTELSS